MRRRRPPREPRRIVVEIVSAADVARLQAEDEKTRAEIKALEKRVEGLHRTFYEFLDTFRRLK